MQALRNNVIEAKERSHQSCPLLSLSSGPSLPTESLVHCIHYLCKSSIHLPLSFCRKIPTYLSVFCPSLSIPFCHLYTYC